MAHLHNQDKARYVAAMFGRISSRYDLLNTVMTAGMHHRWRRLAIDMATHGLAGPALDVATGTGDFAFELAARPGISSVVGLDFCPEMLWLAEAKAQRRGLSGRVGLVTGDALALPFPDGSFACVTSGFSLRNVADIQRALGEMARVIRPGGRVVILEMTPLQGKGLFSRLFPVYFRRVTPWVGALLAGDREAYAYLPQSVEGFPSAVELARMMVKAGLERVAFRKLGLGTVAIHAGRKAE